MTITSRRFPSRAGLLLLGGLALPLAGHALDLDQVNDVTSSTPQIDHISANSPIKLEDHAQAKKIQTYGGSVTLGQHALAKSIKTSKGDVTIGANSEVSKNVQTQSGSITLDQAHVDGAVSSTSGSIELKQATVDGDVQNTNGDITIGANSTVNGGIKILPAKGFAKLMTRTPTVVIGPKAVVKGNLNFAHDTKLKVSDTAQIGQVTGAKVEKFSGAQP